MDIIQASFIVLIETASFYITVVILLTPHETGGSGGNTPNGSSGLSQQLNSSAFGLIKKCLFVCVGNGGE